MKYGEINTDVEECKNCGSPIESGTRCPDCADLKAARGADAGAIHYPMV